MVYKPGDRVLYGIHGVCRIIMLEKKTLDRKVIEYYVLEPSDQPGARYYVPTQNAAAVAKLKPLMSGNELNSLLEDQQLHEQEWIEDENRRKQYYRELINSGDRAKLIRMVHALHKHKQQQLASGRKFHQCDENFLRDAKKLLDSEIALVLDIGQDEVGQYIKNKLNE